MTPFGLRTRLQSDQISFGTLIVSPSPRWPEAVRDCGLDFVFIDTEHIALDRAQLSWMCQTYAAIGLPPLVRIPSPAPDAATMVLDGGAAGVIAPYVETPEQVQALRGAVKKRPIKGKKLQAILAGQRVEAEPTALAAGPESNINQSVMPEASAFGSQRSQFPSPELETYLQDGAKDRLLVVNIESTPAIEALDDILAVPDLDAVLIGPHDLSCSLGVPERYDHPDFLAACETIFRKARAAGVGAGIHFWGSVEQQAHFLKLGANLLIHSGDILLFQRHLKAELKAVKQSAGLQVTDQNPQQEINV